MTTSGASPIAWSTPRSRWASSPEGHRFASFVPAMNAFRSLDDADVKGKRVLLRVDLNVPMQGGKVADATRIEEIAPTITELADNGGKVILLSHLNRPKGRDPKDSLRPVAAEVAKIIKRPVAMRDCPRPVRPSRRRRHLQSAPRSPSSRSNLAICHFRSNSTIYAELPL